MNIQKTFYSLIRNTFDTVSPHRWCHCSFNNVLQYLSIYVGLSALVKNQWSSLPAGQIFGVIFTYRIWGSSAWICTYCGFWGALFGCIQVIFCWLLLCSAILCSWVDPLHSCCMWFWMSDCGLFILSVSESPLKSCAYGTVLFWCGWCHRKLQPSQCCCRIIDRCEYGQRQGERTPTWKLYSTTTRIVV